MFANPLWSIAILLALVLIYIVIRYKHGKPLLDAYKDEGWFKWIVAFRSWLAGSLAGLAIGLPDLLVLIIPGLDLTWLIGESWSKTILGALSTFLLVNTALKTKRDGEKAA